MEITLGHATGQGWRRFRFKRIKAMFLNGVGIVAFRAGPPPLFPAHFPFANPLAVDAHAPVAVNITVTAAADLLRFIETDFVPLTVNKGVTIGSIMAVKAPDRSPAMLQLAGIADNVLVVHDLAGIILLVSQFHAWMTAAALHGCFQALRTGPDDRLGKIAIRLIVEMRHFSN
jgi:hypothetical protein